MSKAKKKPAKNNNVVHHYRPCIDKNVNVTIDSTTATARLSTVRQQPACKGRKMTVIKPHFARVYTVQKGYTDYDDNNDCQAVDIVKLVDKAYNAYVTEYVDNRQTDRPAVTSTDPQTVIDLATACCTSMLRKGITPKMIIIYEQRYSFRKHDFDDIIGTFVKECFEKTIDGQSFDIDVDVTQTIHNAFLTCYRYMYSVGTKCKSTNARANMASIDKLIDDNVNGLSTLDKGLMYYALFDNDVDVNYLISDGLTVNKKTLAKFRLHVQDKLTERQKTVMSYYFDGLSVRDIADIIDIGKSTVSRDIQRILSIIKEQSEIDGITVVKTIDGHVKRESILTKIDRYRPANAKALKPVDVKRDKIVIDTDNSVDVYDDKALYAFWLASRQIFNG